MPVTAITVQRRTSVTVFAYFAVPDRATFHPTPPANPKTTPTDPTAVKFVWALQGGSETTWTYTATSGPISKLSTGVYVATIPTKTATNVHSTIRGTVYGTGTCTASATFAITVTPTAFAT